MVAKSLVKANKSKNFTFRITDELSALMAEAKQKCEQHGLRVNVTKSLTDALEREVKALHKHIQSIEPGWVPGQLELPEIDSAKAPAKRVKP